MLTSAPQVTTIPPGTIAALVLAGVVALHPHAALFHGARLNLLLLSELANARLYLMARVMHLRLSRDLNALGLDAPAFRFVRIQDRAAK